MCHHRTKGKYLVTRQAPGGNDIETGVVFGLTEDAFLRAAAIMEQHDAFS